MKKAFIIISVFFLFTCLTHAEGIFVEVKGSYFSPTEEAFKDIYGSGIVYGGEFGFVVWRNIEIWLGGSYFTKKGELTFTKEKTELEIIPLGGGLRLRFPAGSVSFYGSAGLNIYQYKESNPIGVVNKSGLGFLGKIGGIAKVTGGLFFDFFVSYSYGKLKPADYEVNIGGIEGGVGLGYEF